MGAPECRLELGEVVDGNFVKLIQASKKDIIDNNDDRMFVCVGPTGSGKSMLSLHALRIFNSSATIDCVVGTREKFAMAIKALRDKWIQNIRGEPIILDEANTNSVDATSRWNKQVFSLFMQIRGLNGFHWWNWPTLKTFDRNFVEERLNGVFFCFTKEQHAPRSYAYIPKRALLRLIDNLKSDQRLTFEVLKKSVDKYAAYVGKFKDYTGPLRDQYLTEVKTKTMCDAVDAFANEFGEGNQPVHAKTGPKPRARDRYSITTACKLLNMKRDEVTEKVISLHKRGLLHIAETYDTAGKRWFTDDQVNLIRTAI